MFGTLRSLLSKVEQRFEAPDHAQQQQQQTQGSTPQPHHHQQQPDEVVPGSQLVLYFENRWDQIGKNNSAMLAKLSETEAVLQRTTAECVAKETKLNAIHKQLLDLQPLLSQVDSLTESIQSCVCECMELEHSLTLLCTVSAENHVARAQKSNEDALLKYETSKRNDLTRAYANAPIGHSHQKKQTKTSGSNAQSKRLEDVVLDTVEDQDLQAFYADENTNNDNDNDNNNNKKKNNNDNDNDNNTDTNNDSNNDNENDKGVEGTGLPTLDDALKM